jgi:ArsR family transcriptional regulator, arsenate/arsenite/antimonite-responsive transcriptional repressor
METLNAAELLAALGHEYRLLVEAGPEGVNAGSIAEQLGIPSATASFHLSNLSRVGLIKPRQESRFIYYATDYNVMDELLAFLTDKCCQGQSCLPKTEAVNTTEKRFKKAGCLTKS